MEIIIISIKISLKFVFKGPIDNIPALVQIMAWRRPGDKPLSEPMTSLGLNELKRFPHYLTYVQIWIHLTKGQKRGPVIFSCWYLKKHVDFTWVL